jgi:UDP-N-acetyl-2-amino-2-deoxyglucuronate dehydrogenase
LKYSIVGCGHIAKRHARLMQEYGTLISVCDVIKEKADDFGRLFGAKVFYSLDELLMDEKKPDLIAICSPNGLHATQSIKSMEAGIHVLCEKPMAIRVDDCRRMIDICKETGRYLFVVKQNRFNPPLIGLKKILDEKRLGNIYSLQLNCFWNRDPAYYKDSWRGTLELDGGTLYTQFSHFIDVLFWMFGDIKQTKSVLANYAHKGLIEFEDTGMTILEFENGIIGSLNYTVNSYKKNMEGSLTVFGEKGTIKIGGQYLNRIEYQEIENYALVDVQEGSAANDYGGYQGTMSNHDKVYENMINYLQQKEPIYVDKEDGLKTVEIIEKIYKSARFIL